MPMSSASAMPLGSRRRIAYFRPPTVDLCTDFLATGRSGAWGSSDWARATSLYTNEQVGRGDEQRGVLAGRGDLRDERRLRGGVGERERVGRGAGRRHPVRTSRLE